jgi:hypothetical protein
MRARCPRDPKHKEFITTAHVVEEWLVDEEGNWLETLGSLETAHPPHVENCWSCAICSEAAEVTSD